MLIPALLLLAFGLDWANSMCFLNETSTGNRKVIDRPKVVDEYQCKIICAERKDCLSYVFNRRQCTLNGVKVISGGGTKPYQEWTKKTNGAVCPESFKQPQIDAGYVANPALSRATAYGNDKVKVNTWDPCPVGSIMDITLSDNSHVLQNRLSSKFMWDSKLGSWILVKLTTIFGPFGSYSRTYKNSTRYIRAARCYSIDPEQFSDAARCGGKVPTMAASERFVMNAEVPKYGMTNYCGTGKYFQYKTDIFINQLPAASTEATYITCVDGKWILLGQNINGGIDNALIFTHGICVDPKK